MQGARKAGLDDFNRRYELTRHAVWLAETPAGPMAVVVADLEDFRFEI